MIKKVLPILIALALLGGCSVTANPYDEQIKLGYKLLAQGQYEEAILAFDKAIEIDLKQDRAYIGKAETYVTRLDKNAVVDANESLLVGYEQSQSDRIIDTYISLSDKLVAVDKVDWAIKLLRLGYEITNNEKLNTKLIEIMSSVGSEFMWNLFFICESGDYDAVRDIMLTEEFSNAVQEAPEILVLSGKGVGIYKTGSTNSVYFGGYVDRVREGHGVWIYGWNTLTSDPDRYSFEGEWSNDSPNGEGTLTSPFYRSRGGALHGMSVYKGTLKNGLWDGNVYEESIYVDGMESNQDLYHFNDGVVTVLEIDDMAPPYYGVAKALDNREIEDEPSVWVPESYINSKHGVWGWDSQIAEN